MWLTAREVMTSEVVTVHPSMNITELARLLGDRRISGVPVVDVKGALIGIVSEADILSRKPGHETVRSIMTTDVVAVSESESVQEIACLLSMKRINRVPVVRDRKVVGIVSRTDIVKALAGLPRWAAEASPAGRA
jgi:CBS domain-containing protein